MKLDRAEARDVRESVGRELQHVGHDAQVDAQAFQRLVGVLAAQRLELENLEALLLGRGAQRIGFRARFLRRAENTGDFGAAL